MIYYVYSYKLPIIYDICNRQLIFTNALLYIKIVLLIFTNG